jgi:tetratricopeptide (TPR) repeat protein
MVKPGVKSLVPVVYFLVIAVLAGCHQRIAGSCPEEQVKTPADLTQRTGAELEKAEEHYCQNQLKEAKSIWQHVLARDPHNQPARAGLERLADEIYVGDPDCVFDNLTRDLYHQGMRAFRKKDWDGAEAGYSEAAKLNPDQPQLKKYLEMTHRALAERQQEHKIKSLISLARAAEHKGRWFKAHDHWRDLARRDPALEEVKNGLSWTAGKLKNWAKRELRRAEQALEAGRFRSALSYFKKILYVFPSHKAAGKGKRRARAAIKQEGKQADARSGSRRRFKLGAALYCQGDLTGAVREWEKTLAEDPGNVECREWLTRVRRELAEEKLLNSRRAQAYYADGLAAYQRGKVNEALTAWKQVLALDPGHEKARVNIQRVQQEMQ